MSNPGYVYFVKTSDGATKIGRTRHLGVRMSSLKCELRRAGKSDSIVLVHSIASNNPVWLEKAFHRRFHEKRLRNELFSLSDEDIQPLLLYSRINQLDETNGLIINDYQWKLIVGTSGK